jgi:hypothetical protein
MMDCFVFPVASSAQWIPILSQTSHDEVDDILVVHALIAGFVAFAKWAFRCVWRALELFIV